ncbi:MAG: hypothetical protein COA93_06045 [Alphaproteobacteria bacterium]|nr:MAG: hypothetical protein COA93_06045 [Alphaproteobacteria bacterium]
MHEYQITKYDQTQRDDAGRYVGSSKWTCYSDVGQKFDEKILTLEECLRVEALYIEAAIKLFQLSRLPYLRLTRVELYDWQKEQIRSEGAPFFEPDFDGIDFVEDAKISPENLPTILKMIFRGYGWACLEWKDKCYIHIGWDFYMYIGLLELDIHRLEEISSSGLYVDANYPSPYKAFNLPTNILHIERNIIGEEGIDINYEINLSSEYLEKLKPLWGLSSEHPFLGCFQLKFEHKEMLEDIIKHQFDFNTYEYFIQTVDWID